MRVVHETSVNGQLSSFFVELIIIRLFELKIIERLLPLYIVYSFINKRFYCVNVNFIKLIIYFSNQISTRTLSLCLSRICCDVAKLRYLTQHISPHRYRVNSRYRQHARGPTAPTSEAIYVETRDNGNEGPGKQLRGSGSDISKVRR